MVATPYYTRLFSYIERFYNRHWFSSAADNLHLPQSVISHPCLLPSLGTAPSSNRVFTFSVISECLLFMNGFIYLCLANLPLANPLANIWHRCSWYELEVMAVEQMQEGIVFTLEIYAVVVGAFLDKINTCRRQPHPQRPIGFSPTATCWRKLSPIAVCWHNDVEDVFAHRRSTTVRHNSSEHCRINSLEEGLRFFFKAGNNILITTIGKSDHSPTKLQSSNECLDSEIKLKLGVVGKMDASSFGNWIGSREQNASPLWNWIAVGSREQNGASSLMECCNKNKNMADAMDYTANTAIGYPSGSTEDEGRDPDYFSLLVSGRDKGLGMGKCWTT
eukprot:Gb_02743 [translate_table: standard]